MAQFSKITITFTRDLDLNESVSFFLFSQGLGMKIKETWNPVRNQPYIVEIGTPTTFPGERSAINYARALLLDYLGGGFFELSRNANEIILYTTSPALTFSGTSSGFPTGVDYHIDNDTSILFAINDITFSEASTDPCSKVSVSITTSQTADKYTSPVIDSNPTNPFVFEMLRGTNAMITAEKDRQLIHKTINAPDKLNVDNIEINLLPTPEGSTASINVQNTNLDLEYSLDNIDFKTSNIFSGLFEGDHTIWVKDQYGCKISKNFHADAFGIDKPYFYISKSNSIQYALREDFGNCGPYKNDENTLSNETDVPLPYTEIQQFQSCDHQVPTQFRSNRENISAKIRQCGSATEEDLTVVKKTNNMRLKDRRDAIKCDLGNGKTGIYFTSGNIYDYTFGNDIGNYTLNGLLPLWGKINNYIKIDTAWFVIENIVFDEFRNAEVLVISNTYTGQDIAVQVSSLYNKEIYEVYEFYVDMGLYLNKKIKVEFFNKSDYLPDLAHESEWIDIKEHQKNTVEIRYKNKTNTDIFYATGIENLIRIPIEKISGKPEAESEVHKTDTSTVLLSAENYETNVFEFQPITKQMMWKLVQALAHSDVKIDGVDYVKESIETEGPLEETNLYVITATMIKSKGKEKDSSTLDFSGSNVEIPGLIKTDSGYVEY